ncbi:MAG: ribonuclease HI [Balneolaceae bacterium]
MPEQSKPVLLYTDGACSGNPGPGGWGALLIWNGNEKELSGGEPHTTNNRMEMQAVIEGLRALTRPCAVDVYSDSALIVNAFRKGWIDNWQQKGWKKADKKPVENRDLWEALLAEMNRHHVRYHKVKGHSGDVRNDRVDALAVQASKKFQ